MTVQVSTTYLVSGADIGDDFLIETANDDADKLAEAEIAKGLDFLDETTLVDFNVTELPWDLATCRQKMKTGEVVEFINDAYDLNNSHIKLVIQPPEPPCCTKEGHDWDDVSDSEGSSEEICTKCGCGKVTDPWGTVDGVYPVETVEYTPEECPEKLRQQIALVK